MALRARLLILAGLSSSLACHGSQVAVFGNAPCRQLGPPAPPGEARLTWSRASRPDSTLLAHGSGGIYISRILWANDSLARYDSVFSPSAFLSTPEREVSPDSSPGSDGTVGRQPPLVFTVSPGNYQLHVYCGACNAEPVVSRIAIRSGYRDTVTVHLKRATLTVCP